MFVLVLLLVLAVANASDEEKHVTPQEALRRIQNMGDRDALLKERVYKIMGRFCGNTDEQLKKWAAPSSSEAETGSPYIEKSMALLAQMKAATLGEDATLHADFMKNATVACLSVEHLPKSSDARTSSLWRLACIVNYRRGKWAGPKVQFDPATEEALEALDSVMQCPQQVVFLAGRQLDHEHLMSNMDSLIASGVITHDRKDWFLEKLGPYPDKLEPLPKPGSNSAQEKPINREEL